MKKKMIIFLIILLIIIGVINGIRKFNNSKVKYEISKVNLYNYLQYYDNKQYGVIDKDGNTIISAEYKKVVIPNPEKDVFVCYDENDNTKILNSKGEELFTKYNKVEPIKLKNVASVLCYEKSVLKYEKDGLYGLIDFDGKKITKNIYNSIENLQSTEGKLLVSKDDKYGVINIKGTKLIETNYDSIKTDGYYDENQKYVTSGFIVSNTTDDGYKFGYVDYTGKKILSTKYNELIRINDLEEEYLIVADNGKYGVYKGKKQIIEPDYQSIIYDESGLLMLQKNKKYGMADLEGNIKIGVDYTDIEPRGIYIYVSNENEKVVYDKDGDKIDINYNKSIYETENENYRISTIVNNDITYYGIENKDGAALVNENYRYIEYAYNDYFIAKNDKGNLGVINANGKVLIDFEYSLIQKVKDKNMIQILNDKNDKIYLYSSALQVVCEMKNAILSNEENFIKIYNDKNEKYFDNNGKEISKDDEKVKENTSKKLPASIGDYVKIQYSLDNAYYVKK